MNNNRGSTILMALMASGLVLTSFLIILSSMQGAAQNVEIQKIKQAASIIRHSLMASLDNDSSWANIVALNASTNGTGCLRTNGATCASGPLELKYYDMDLPLTGTPSEQIVGFYQRYMGREPQPAELADKLTIYPTGLTRQLVQDWLANCPECDSVKLKTGFTMDGNTCRNFGSNDGLDCPFQFLLTWECSTSPCPTTAMPVGSLVALEPRIRLRATFSLKLRNQNISQMIRTNPFSFDFIRGTNSKTLARFCNSISGVFDQVSQICKNANNTGSAVDCAAALGLDPKFVRFGGYRQLSDGSIQPICAPDPKLNGWCGPGTAIVAMRRNGTFQCGPF